MSFFKNIKAKMQGNGNAPAAAPATASPSADATTSPRNSLTMTQSEADLVASIPPPEDDSDGEPDSSASTTSNSSNSSSSARPATFVSESRACAAQRLSFIPHMRTVTWGGFTEDDLYDILVRGPTYLTDKKKVPCAAPLFRLAHADVFLTKKDEARVLDVSTLPGCYADMAYQKRVTQPSAFPAHVTHPLSAMFIINIVFPGPNNCTMNLVQYYERRVPPADVLASMQQAAQANGTATAATPFGNGDDTLAGVDVQRVATFDRVYQRFLEGTDAHRDGCVKIIPRVVEGGWVVRKTVGRVPAILGKKVKQTYVLNRERNLIQVTADIGTSNVAGKIITLIKSKCKTLVVDMSFLLQSDRADELPECVIGGIRVSHCDLDRVLPFEENKVKNGPVAVGDDALVAAVAAVAIDAADAPALALAPAPAAAVASE